MKTAIETFFAADMYGVIGVSASKRKFGNAVYRAMKDHGLKVFPVHRTLESVEGDRCFHSVRELPDTVSSVVTVVPPLQTEKVVEECASKGITAIWMQQGSQSNSAIDAARRHGITVVHGECVMMYLEPVKSLHALHRWVRKLLGKHPH